MFLRVQAPGPFDECKPARTSKVIGNTENRIILNMP